MSSDRADQAPIARRLARAGVLALALAACRVEVVRGDVPALSREYQTDDYLATPRKLSDMLARHSVALAVTGGPFLRGDEAGSANAFNDAKRVPGGTAVVQLQTGRFGFGGHAIADTPHNVESDEFPSRIFASAYVPEAHVSIWVASGFDHDGFAGAEVTVETLASRWRAVNESADLRPRVWVWIRARHLDEANQNVFTPVAGLFLQHSVVLASQAYLGVTARSDLSSDGLPASAALLQFGLSGGEKKLGVRGDPDAPDAGTSPISWRWYTTMGYSVPLDDRAAGRFVAQLGLRFVHT